MWLNELKMGLVEDETMQQRFLRTCGIAFRSELSRLARQRGWHTSLLERMRESP